MTITKRMAGIYNKALYYFKTGTDGKGLDMQALAFAIIALEKQIPKKTVEIPNRVACCPKCHDDFYIEDIGQIFKSKFCPNCGQAIDWN